MAITFLHGAEVIEVQSGPQPIRESKTAVVGLWGTAPVHLVDAALRTVNKPVLILSPEDAVRHFGPDTPGYTIPADLAGLFAEGATTVIAWNVFDPAVHKDAGGAPDPSKVTVLDLVGLDLPTGRTGIKAAVDAPGLLGFAPKILIAPDWSTHAGVIGALRQAAEILRAVTFVDAPVGLAPQEATMLRMAVVPGVGDGPPVAGVWNFADERVGLCYPHGLEVNPHVADGLRLAPLSRVAAGIMARVDQTEGFWQSPSNRDSRTLKGLERPITWSPNGGRGFTTEANLLNEAGIITIATGWGMSPRLWGNRSSAWPTVTLPKNFLSNRRISDVLHESVETAMVAQGFVDKAATKVMKDGVIQTVEAYMDGLKQRGALVDGGCTFEPSKNPTTEIALGHLVFSISYAATTPAERITFESFQDIALLKRIYGGN